MFQPSRFILVAFVVLSLSCERTYVPRPKGFHRIDLPLHEYRHLGNTHPYLFEYSKYARIEQHKSAFSEEHWIDIVYPAYRATVQLTYKSLTNDKNGKIYNELINDSHKLASKHDVKAYSIDEHVMTTPLGKTAILFELTGEVPSQFQFYVTDTTRHFLRGALYLKTATKNDSLAPVIEYLKIDIVHLINTLEWWDGSR